jgi:putative membrane protein
LVKVITAATLALVATHGWGVGWGAPWLFLLIPLFWIGVFVLIFTLVGRRWRRFGGPGNWQGGHPGWQGWQQAQASRNAEATLAERFAQGDIDEVEYRARLEVLRANRPAAQ